MWPCTIHEIVSSLMQFASSAATSLRKGEHIFQQERWAVPESIGQQLLHHVYYWRVVVMFIMWIVEEEISTSVAPLFFVCLVFLSFQVFIRVLGLLDYTIFRRRLPNRVLFSFVDSFSVFQLLTQKLFSPVCGSESMMIYCVLSFHNQYPNMCFMLCLSGHFRIDRYFALEKKKTNA